MLSILFDRGCSIYLSTGNVYLYHVILLTYQL